MINEPQGHPPPPKAPHEMTDEELNIGGFDIQRQLERQHRERMKAQQTAKPDITIQGDMHIGNKYTAGLVGAMGPQAHAHDINQVQARQIDFKVLTAELASLRHAMRQAAQEPEHDIATGEIAAAETAARKGDTNAVMLHLKSAGKFALDVATKTCVNVATEWLKKSAGL